VAQAFQPALLGGCNVLDGHVPQRAVAGARGLKYVAPVILTRRYAVMRGDLFLELHKALFW